MLRSEILVPAHPHVRDTLIGALACGALTVLAVVTEPSPRPQTTVAPPTIALTETAGVAVAVAREDAPAQPLHSEDLQLVFSAGNGIFMKLTSDDIPNHGTPRLFSESGEESAIATVRDQDVPARYRVWKGRKVIVDNACETTVTGFAVVSRLTGDTGYSDIPDAEWTAGNVLGHGSTVFAARLAGCPGTFARDAALPKVIVPTELRNAKLVARARAVLIASEASQETQREWEQFDQQGNWHEAEDVQFATRVVRHPTTGVTWVSVHGSLDHGCGDATVNVWGLFRVKDDGSLASVQLRKLDDLWSIDEIIDIDNDGNLELIGKPWLGLDTVVVRASGEELDRLSLAFYGCPC